ncbi:hypothetical protein J1N35_028891 [Gossypium stocksii]|uniref:UBN2 domain-containing protein n=1 Tax=Gossypium stocksii TaxID=47602 RepID=A0A9D3UYS8_9ROSI|nr:hypothetical protein J1N35_028891 [Gossypium stocksii]
MEIREKLEVTHKGTSRVKESKISLIALDYELFKIKMEERINDIFDWSIDIFNGHKVFRKTYANKKIAKKILNSLPKSWEAKKVGVAFKSATHKKEDDSSNEDNDEEMTMFAIEFKKFMKLDKAKRPHITEFIKREPNDTDRAKNTTLRYRYSARK